PASNVGIGVSVAASLAALMVYVRTLAPGLPTGDSGDLITAAWVFGVPHPPGYPLYMLLAHLFGQLPFGSPALRINLFSAVLDAATVGLTTFCLYRLLTPRVGPIIVWQAALGAAVGGLLLAFSTAFWTYSLVAEVFPLNSLLAAALLLLALEWERCPRRVRLLW